MNRVASALAVLIFFVASMAFADIPRIISYQGVLTDGSGSVVADGNYSIAFRIYTTASGESPIWEETQMVTVSKGIFEAKLGSITPLNLLFDRRYYLGIAVEGGSELEPRIELDSAPYSFTTSRVEGATNVFPSDGKVGIGTKMPTVPLHVTAGEEQVGIQFDGNNSAWASIYINSVKTNANPFLGLLRGYVLCGGMYSNDSNSLVFRVGSGDHVIITQQGNVGIGDFAPNQKLAVNGGVRIANSTTASAGTIRFTGSDFEGYDGSSWKSFTATGTGTVPPGAAGQTLRNDGSNWVATSNLYIDGTNIGIGTTSPITKLHISGVGTEAILVESSLLWGGSNLSLKTSGGDYDFLQVSKFGPTASGNVSGIPAANLSLINVGLNAGPLMFRTASNSNMHFVTNNKEWLRLEADGSLDYFGPSYNKLLEVSGASQGGKLEILDSLENTAIVAQASPNGSGQIILPNQYLWAGLGVFLDGNYEGSGSPVLAVMEGGTLPADDSVILPTGSISAEEIINEPGLANMSRSESVNIGEYTIIASRSIVAPYQGLVLAIANAGAEILHYENEASMLTLGISTSPSSIPESCRTVVGVSSSEPTCVRYFSTGCHGVFNISSSGTYTFYFLGSKTDGIASVSSSQLTLLFVPTAYGVVNPVGVASAGYRGDNEVAMGTSLTESDVTLERETAEALERSRIERELEQARAKIDELMARIKSK